jgi:hypothetical protein
MDVSISDFVSRCFQAGTKQGWAGLVFGWLVLHSEVKEINLVSGSHTIPDALYGARALATDPKPEWKFGISYHQIRQTVGPSVNVDPKSEFPKELVGVGQNPESYAFIQLTKR